MNIRYTQGTLLKTQSPDTGAVTELRTAIASGWENEVSEARVTEGAGQTLAFSEVRTQLLIQMLSAGSGVCWSTERPH